MECEIKNKIFEIGPKELFFFLLGGHDSCRFKCLYKVTHQYTLLSLYDMPLMEKTMLRCVKGQRKS